MWYKNSDYLEDDDLAKPVSKDLGKDLLKEVEIGIQKECLEKCILEHKTCFSRDETAKLTQEDVNEIKLSLQKAIDAEGDERDKLFGDHLGLLKKLNNERAEKYCKKEVMDYYVPKVDVKCCSKIDFNTVLHPFEVNIDDKEQILDFGSKIDKNNKVDLETLKYNLDNVDPEKTKKTMSEIVEKLQKYGVLLKNTVVEGKKDIKDGQVLTLSKEGADYVKELKKEWAETEKSLLKFYKPTDKELQLEVSYQANYLMKACVNFTANDLAKVIKKAKNTWTVSPSRVRKALSSLYKDGKLVYNDKKQLVYTRELIDVRRGSVDKKTFLYYPKAAYPEGYTKAKNAAALRHKLVVDDVMEKAKNKDIGVDLATLKTSLDEVDYKTRLNVLLVKDVVKSLLKDKVNLLLDKANKFLGKETVDKLKKVVKEPQFLANLVKKVVK